MTEKEPSDWKKPEGSFVIEKRLLRVCFSGGEKLMKISLDVCISVYSAKNVCI